MNNEDLVKRGDVKAFRRVLFMCGKLVSFVTIKDINCVPAVPREMSAVEYEKALRRMHEIRPFPDELIAYSHMFDTRFDDPKAIEKAVAIVEKWAREHPEERSEE